MSTDAESADRCPCCGSGEVTFGYGFAFGGLGGYTICLECGELLTKHRTDAGACFHAIEERKQMAPEKKELAWFNTDGSGVAVHTEDERVVLYGNIVPDEVLVPEESPVLPGARLRVRTHGIRTCPKCGGRLVRVLALERGMFVAECQPVGCGYVFYRKGRRALK